jgi:hypothetical protein
VARCLVILAAVLGMVAMAPGNAWACSCRISTPQQLVTNAETIVDGSVVYTTSNGIETTYSVKVDQVFKGKAGEREKLMGEASLAACGLGDLATDRRYLFFISGEHPGLMKVSSCGGSRAYDPAFASKVASITGTSYGPIPEPGSATSSSGSGGGGHGRTIALGTVGVLVLLTGGVLWLRKRTDPAWNRP